MEKPSQRITLIIVDDHPVVVEGLRTMFSNYGDVDVVAVCCSGEEALSILSRKAIDVALVDMRMKPMGGIDVIRNARRIAPKVKLVVLSSYDLEEEVYQAMRAGATGYLSKYASAKELVEAIRLAAKGEVVMPADLRARLEQRGSRKALSTRQREILEMVAKGLTNKEIAGIFGVSQFTVRNQIATISAKLDVSDRTEAALVAVEQGIIIVS